MQAQILSVSASAIICSKYMQRISKWSFFSRYSILKISSVSDMDISCISCGEVVSGKRHALQCDGCARWQHRLCGTGMCF